MKIFGLLGTAALLTAIAAPASAASVVVASCQNLSVVGNSCLFNGNINENTNPLNVNSHKNAEAAYNALFNPDITLNFLTASDLGGFGGFGSASGNNATLTTSNSGTWSLPGYSVQYMAVKTSNQFVIYNVGGVSGGSWNTSLLGNKELSHLSFFGAQQIAVPEPGAWALLILGFGALGATLRRRRPAQAKLHFA